MSEESCRLHVYPEANFGGFSEADGTVKFYTRIQALLTPDAVVLDIGCGRGAQAGDDIDFRRNLRTLRGRCRRVIGIDVDEAGRQNPFVDEFRLIRGERWPVEDASIDLCVSDYVLEHLAEPEPFFAECARVLKPQGALCARTPNKYGYVALLARCVPNRWHAAVLRMLGKRRGAEDTFPTVYRCNTRRKIKSLLRAHGFEGCVRGVDDEPTYLVFSPAAYRMGAVLHRVMPPPLKGNLFVFGRKAA